MKKKVFISLVGLIVFLSGIITVSSCSKDEFFGIKDVSCIDSRRMHEIAESDLYVDYQKAFILMTQELCELDSSNRGRVVITDGDTIFDNVHIYSFDKVNELFDSLLNSYPELKNADQADLNEIQTIALSNNSELRKMTSKISANYLKRTRGYDYINEAMEWIGSLPCAGNPTNGSTFNSIYEPGDRPYTYELTPCTTVGNAMNLAVIWSRNHEDALVGGLGWSNSGLMIYCEQSIENNTSLLIPASAGNPLPLMDFILHPDGNLFPTESDMAWWSSSPEVMVHYIISTNYEYSVW